jgi:hypothetical protein
MACYAVAGLGFDSAAEDSGICCAMRIRRIHDRKFGIRRTAIDRSRIRRSSAAAQAEASFVSRNLFTIQVPLKPSDWLDTFSMRKKDHESDGSRERRDLFDWSPAGEPARATLPGEMALPD